jgi:uncharacterized metal-binding protein
LVLYQASWSASSKRKRQHLINAAIIFINLRMWKISTCAFFSQLNYFIIMVTHFKTYTLALSSYIGLDAFQLSQNPLTDELIKLLGSLFITVIAPSLRDYLKAKIERNKINRRIKRHKKAHESTPIISPFFDNTKKK